MTITKLILIVLPITSLGLLILLVGKILHTCFETLKNVDIMVVHCFSLDASATN